MVAFAYANKTNIRFVYWGMSHHNVKIIKTRFFFVFQKNCYFYAHKQTKTT
jgi:hypothetical protein